MVAGEGVHGVENDRFDARFPPVAVAVIQDWVEKTFGLARAGAGGDEGGFGRVVGSRREPGKGGHLMGIGRKGGRDGQRQRIAGGAAKGQA